MKHILIASLALALTAGPAFAYTRKPVAVPVVVRPIAQSELDTLNTLHKNARAAHSRASTELQIETSADLSTMDTMIVAAREAFRLGNRPAFDSARGFLTGLSDIVCPKLGC